MFHDESDSISNRVSKIPKNINAMFLDNEINSNLRQTTKNDNQKKRYGSQNIFGSKGNISDVLNINIRSPTKYTNEGGKKKGSELRKSNSNPVRGAMVNNTFYNANEPPPLPPRNPMSPSGASDPEPVNSISKQMSYPLVATCATLVNNYVSNSSFYLIFIGFFGCACIAGFAICFILYFKLFMCHIMCLNLILYSNFSYLLN